MRSGRSSSRLLLRFVGVLVALLPVVVPRAQAADRFVYTRHRELHAVDAKGGGLLPWGSEVVAGSSRATLGVTGRVVVSRRTSMVEPGGQLFVFGTLPESLAAHRQQLDVLVDAGTGFKARGSIPFEPGDTRRFARVFVLPDLTPGPARVEVRVRGLHESDWQEIASEEFLVPEDAKLRFGLAADGNAPAEWSVEARVEGKSKPIVLADGTLDGASRAWLPQEVDLGKVEGRKVRLAFRSRPAKGVAAAGVVWGAPDLQVDERRRAFPVVMVVSLDSLRVSSVGLYSGSTATPFLDSFFGADGAVMAGATTPSVATLPAHASLLTGLQPADHGVRDPEHALAPSLTTLAQAFRANGWHTAAFTEGGALAGELGLARGFDVYDEGTSNVVDPSSADALARARKWLDGYSGAPLFLFVHTYATRPVHAGIDAVADPGARTRHLAAYVQQVRAADQGVRALLATVKDRFDADQALFVLTSGHGEEFFEHRAVGHGTHLYDEAMRVPLLLKGSKVKQKGRLDESVSLVDVAPTLLTLAGVPVPASMKGRPFARLLQSGAAPEAGPRVAEATRPVRLTDEGMLELWGAPSYALREGSRKVIWNAGGDDSIEAYDLAADPREQRNLAGAGTLPAWAQRMAASLRAYGAWSSRGPSTAGNADLSEANRSRLESLGYAR